MTGGSLHLERSPHPNFDMGIWGGKVQLSFQYIYGISIALQAANLAGFRAPEDPRFEAGIPDFMNGILNFSIHI